MPTSAKEFTKITALIKLILNGYPGNWAILREYLQNSDDSGATEQTFILDERSHPTASLVDGVLVGAQGPALIAINNGIITERDWEALLKINSSSKQEDQTQTGKNGLGFRASYHLTENPHILSGSTLMILDPHNEFTNYPGGVSIDLVEEGQKYQDQIQPFAACIDGLTFPYKGTAFRLPLRTEAQAKKSDIKQTPTTPSEIKEVLDEFSARELEEAILFLKHITSIQLFRIDSTGKKVCLSKVMIDPPLPSPCPPSLTRRTTVTSTDGTTTSREWMLRYSSKTKDEANALITKRLGYNIGNRLTQDKLSGAVDIAFPLDGPSVRGRLFTLLPLPQYTDFPVHLNAVFALDPSRQNLKNIQEVGVVNSRERLLVEWNKVIFDTWTPDIWSHLLADLPTDFLISANWNLWPPETHGEDCYWSALTTTFTNVVVSRQMAIFPTVPGRTATSRLVRITDPDVLLAASTTQISLALLSDLGIAIVQPPKHIYAALVAGRHAATLSPENLHSVLLRNPLTRSQYERYDYSDLKQVMDYLVFSSGTVDVKNLADLPWVRLARNDSPPVSLQLAGIAVTKFFIPQTDSEAQIFVDSGDMLAWDAFSDRLRAQLSRSFASKVLGVAVMGPRDVVAFLKRRLSHLQSPNEEILNVQSDCDYAIEFWTWVGQWAKRDTFFQSRDINGISALFLLPTCRGSLRKWSSRIINFDLDSNDDAYVAAWNALDVYSISQEIPYPVLSKLRSAAVIPGPNSWDQILYLIDNANLASSSGSQTVFESIRNYLLENLPRNTGSLNAAQKAKFRRFPIFMIHSRTSNTSLRTLDGYCIYVQVDRNLLPVLRGYPNAIYVDATDPATLRFARLLDHNVKIENEFSILQMAIDNWDMQPNDKQDEFIDRIFQYRSYQLPNLLLQSLTELEFVVVNETTERKKPCNLIDPRSILHNLYLGEPGRMPDGRFREARLLSVMNEFGFLKSSLDGYVVRDRVEYLTDPSNDGDPLLIDKAGKFVDILNREWNSDYTLILTGHRSSKWIPSEGSTVTSRLVSPSESRDNHRDHDNHPYYFDWVLTHFQDHVFRPEFRAALGWSTRIPSDVLVAQFTATLDHSSNRTNRLIKLLTYLNRLLVAGDIDASFLQNLRSAVDGRAWVPTNSSDTGIVEARYALLLEPSGTRLRHPFDCVRSGLLNCLPILRSLGCTDRPPLDELIVALGAVPADISASLATLHEIADQHRDLLDDRLIADQLMIPGADGQGHPLSRVYFPDRQISVLDFGSDLQQMFAAHGSISSSLAESLKIPLLSSLVLGDDDDEEEQMDIDFVTVIRQFLSDYDPQYALNEILANANDAGASTVSILLDQRRQSSLGKLIDTKFKSLVSCETLFFVNDARLTPRDFKGIRRVGRGGKQEQLDTHGRHGLGALSLYYFTDVATIISGNTVLILDPSSQYLPPLSNRRKRTSCLRTISEMISQFPGQMKRYESLFGFSASNPSYDGTIFCLPLRASITEKACNVVKAKEYLERSYRQLASRALLFTDLESITAKELSQVSENIIWSFHSRRTDDQRLGPRSEFHSLALRDFHADAEEKWMIASTETGVIPDTFFRMSQRLKLTGSAKVQLAINVRKIEDKTFLGYPFSTVSLPRQTSLPFHVNARFAISSNRQDLVLNPSDSAGNMDGDTSFNSWILGTLVPPLYFDALRRLVSLNGEHEPQLRSSNWFFSRCSDIASQITRDAFYEALPNSNYAIIRDVTGHLISFSEAVFSAKGEPPAVTACLTGVRPPTYVNSPLYKAIAHIEGSTVVTPPFVHQVLLENIDQPLSSLSITQAACFDIMNYLAQESSLTLTGLPLLALESGEIVTVPSASDAPVYRCRTPGVAEAFSASQFLMVGSYDPKVIARLLSDTSINVIDLTQDNAISLVSAESQNGSDQWRNKWAKDFWKYHYQTLPGPPSIESLERSGLPLIEATGGSSSSLLPINQCRPDTVIYNTHTLDKDIIGIFHTVGIAVITITRHNLPLTEFFEKRFKKNALNNVLLCILSHGISSFFGASLNSRSETHLSTWIQTHIATALDLWTRDPSSMPINKSDLMKFPIWNVYSNGAHHRSGVSRGLRILPVHLAIQAIAPYLDRDTVVAPWSYLLLRFLELCSSRSESAILWSPSEILSVVSLPATVTSRNEIANLKTFLLSMFRYSNDSLKSCRWSVPDRHGTLRPVGDLYDDGTSLFRSTLRFTEPPAFIHDDFKSFVPQLRGLGLIHEITIQTFSRCANAVSAAYHDHVLNAQNSNELNIVRQMAEDAFSVYQNQIPSLMLLQRYFDWSSLDNISFVLRKTQRRQGATYDIRDNYVSAPLPLILPPSSFVLPAHEPIAWTQRALFLVEPIQGLVTVNQRLGIPSAEEVVAHLVLLTTVIALDHPGDRTLLSDIKATYTWLNENAISAKTFLQQSKTKKLFLNVEDPSTDSWVNGWASAEEVVLNMEFDQGPLKILRGFLKPYEALLRAAGCFDIKTLAAQEQAGPLSSKELGEFAWRTELDEMRKSNTQTDMEFLPTLEPVPTGTGGTTTPADDDDIVFTPISPTAVLGASQILDRYSYAGVKRVERKDLRAHRVIMVAAVPHLRAQQSWNQKAQPGGGDEIMFYGSAFAAKAVIDFVYTGELELSAVTKDKTELTHIMHELLNVLPVVDEWGMTDLKHKIEWEIISKHDIIRRLPHEYDTLLSYATKYSADQILRALKELEPMRAHIQTLNSRAGLN